MIQARELHNEVTRCFSTFVPTRDCKPGFPDSRFFESRKKYFPVGENSKSDREILLFCFLGNGNGM